MTVFATDDPGLVRLVKTTSAMKRLYDRVDGLCAGQAGGVSLTPKTTDRGYARISFKDHHGDACSLSESSLADDEAVWFGVDEVEPKVLVEGKGWVPVPMPDGTLLSGHMLLTRAQVAAILPHLARFAATGSLSGK